MDITVENFSSKFTVLLKYCTTDKRGSMPIAYFSALCKQQIDPNLGLNPVLAKLIKKQS